LVNTLLDAPHAADPDAARVEAAARRDGAHDLVVRRELAEPDVPPGRRRVPPPSARRPRALAADGGRVRDERAAAEGPVRARREQADLVDLMVVVAAAA
jgi:hypothetical protein